MDLQAERYVNSVIQNRDLKAVSTEEIEEETKADETLQQLMEAIKKGKITGTRLNDYKTIFNDLSMNKEQTLILRGKQIVLPASLQERALKIAHEGH